jgi:hypothetical protein
MAHICPDSPPCPICHVDRIELDNTKLRAEIERLSYGILQRVKEPCPLIQGSAVDAALALIEDRSKLLLQVDQSRSINHDLADVLRCLEWNNEGFCPWCMGKRPNHNGVCKLQTMIAKGYITEKRVVPSQKIEHCKSPACNGDDNCQCKCYECLQIVNF